MNILITISASLVVLWIIFLPNLGRLLGYNELWSDHSEFKVRGKTFNGLRTYYIMFIPVHRSGFNHSTWLWD